LKEAGGTGDIRRLFELFNAVIQEVDEWVHRQPQWKPLLDREAQEFLGVKPGNSVRVTGEPQEVIEFQLLHEYLTLDLLLPPENLPAVDLFLQRERSRLTVEEIEALEGWRQQRISAFEVLERVEGNRLKVRDLLAETERSIQPQRLIYDPGTFLLARIMPFRDLWYFTNVVAPIPAEFRYGFLRTFRHFQGDLNKNRLTAKELVMMIKGSPEGSGSVERAELELVRLLAQWEVADLTLPEILKAVKEGVAGKKSPNHIVEKILRQSRSPNRKALPRLLALVQRLWNDEAGRRVRPEDERGPIEHQVMADLMNLSSRELRLEGVPLLRTQEEFQRLADRWLETPQEELGGRTPREVIFEERRNRGDPRTELGISFEMKRIDVPGFSDQKLYDRALEHMRLGRFALAIRDFKAFLPLIGHDPERYRLLYNLGVAYALMGHKRHAEELCHQALEINPSYEIARKHLKRLKRATPEQLRREGLFQQQSARPENLGHLSAEEEWTPEALALLSTSAIVKKMQRWLPNLTLNRFTAEAARHVSCDLLMEEVFRSAADLSDDDQDFLWMASEELWTRCLPDRPRAESLQAELEKKIGDRMPTSHKALKILPWFIAHPAWNILPPAALWAALKRMGIPSVDEQIHDCLDALRLAKQWPEIQSWVEQFETLTGALDLTAYRAESLMRMGEVKRGVQLFQDLMIQRPDDPWTYWHEGWTWLELDLPHLVEARAAFARMREVAGRVPFPLPRRHAIRLALEGLLEACADEPALLEVAQRELDMTLYQFEEEDVSEWIAIEGKIAPVPQVLPCPSSVGRNAPCPCGSGKKYKKCCGP